MAVHQFPGNDLARFTFIKTSFTTHGEDAAKGVGILTPKTVNRLESILSPFELAMESITKSSTARAREVAEKNSALDKLNTYVRDFWAAARNRINREELPAANLKYYQLPLSGLLPRNIVSADLITVAKNIVKGDAQAVADGYEAMSNPSAEQLVPVIEAAEKEFNDVQSADEIVDRQEAELAEIRVNADQIIRKVLAELRFFLDEESEESKRRIMRRYGVRFRSEMETAEA